MKKLIALLLAAILVLSLAACAGNTDPTKPSEDPKPSSDTPSSETPNEPDTVENPNLADFVNYVDQNWDINEYYTSKGVESEATIRGDKWIVNVPDVFTTEMPKAAKEYTIGFSLYYSVDEVGSMIM